VTRAGVLAAAIALSSCGPPPLPEYITGAQDLSSAPAAEDAREAAPSIYEKGRTALARAVEAHAHGDEQEARTAALEASIHFKTAIAVSRRKGAANRIADCEDRIAAAGDDLSRFTSLRLDTGQRFLKLIAFHEDQSDLAARLLSEFEADEKTLSELSGEQREAWLQVEGERLAGVLQGARATVLAAEVLGARELLASELAQMEQSLADAEAARDESWEVLRPLVDDASLRAARLLVHTRTLAEPGPLANPAADAALVERLVAALEGGGAMVVPSARGIVVSLADAWNVEEAALAPGVEETIGRLAEALDGATATVLVEGWLAEGCEADACGPASSSLAAAGAESLRATGLDAERIESHGWGDAPLSEAGHCLAATCEGGRLDVVILALDE
jgi:hypothetical protein